MAYWGNGRFSIIGTTLYDEEKKGEKHLMLHVATYRYQNGILFCKGEGGYLVLDLTTEVSKAYQKKQGIPAEYGGVVEMLDNTNPPGNFFPGKQP
jgi:hypothetical protein